MNNNINIRQNGETMKKPDKSHILFLSLSLAVVLLLSLGCGGEKSGEIVSGPTIDFVRGYEEAMTAAKEKNQPVLIDFYTDWCRWCKVMDTVTFIDPLTVELSKSVVFAKVNAEVDTIAAQTNSVHGYPSILLFDSNGKEIDRIVGYLPGPEFVETINNYLNGIGTVDYYKALADSAPTPEIDFNLAEKYGERGMYEEAEGYYQKVIKENKNNDGEYTSGAMQALASNSLSLDKYDEAVARYKEVKTKFTDSAIVDDADIMIAICYRMKGDTTTAIKAFEDYLKAHPNSPDTGYAIKQIDKLKNPPPPEEGK